MTRLRWPEARRAGIWALTVAAASALVFVIAANYGFSPWMHRSEYQAIWQKIEGQEK